MQATFAIRKCITNPNEWAILKQDFSLLGRWVFQMFGHHCSSICLADQFQYSSEQRITHPGTHSFPDATFDFLFTRDLKASSPIVTQTNASDHWPVTRNFRLR